MSDRIGFKVACVNWGTDSEVKAVSYFLAEDGGGYLYKNHRTWAEAVASVNQRAVTYSPAKRISHLMVCEADSWDPPCEWGCNE